MFKKPSAVEPMTNKAKQYFLLIKDEVMQKYSQETGRYVAFFEDSYELLPAEIHTFQAAVAYAGNTFKKGEIFFWQIGQELSQKEPPHSLALKPTRPRGFPQELKNNFAHFLLNERSSQNEGFVAYYNGTIEELPEKIGSFEEAFKYCADNMECTFPLIVQYRNEDVKQEKRSANFISSELPRFLVDMNFYSSFYKTPNGLDRSAGLVKGMEVDTGAEGIHLFNYESILADVENLTFGIVCIANASCEYRPVFYTNINQVGIVGMKMKNVSRAFIVISDRLIFELKLHNKEFDFGDMDSKRYLQRLKQFFQTPNSAAKAWMESEVYEKPDSELKKSFLAMGILTDMPQMGCNGLLGREYLCQIDWNYNHQTKSLTFTD